jgi:hypothetical protein
MATTKRFDAIAKASVTASFSELFVTGLGLALLVPFVALTRLTRQVHRLDPVKTEDTCYAAGGYVVEVENRPITDWCCVCEDSKGAICVDAAPKAQYAATDHIGRFRAQSVTCLLAGDKPAAGCTAICVQIPVRKSFSGFGG